MSKREMELHKEIRRLSMERGRLWVIIDDILHSKSPAWKARAKKKAEAWLKANK